MSDYTVHVTNDTVDTSDEQTQQLLIQIRDLLKLIVDRLPPLAEV